MSLHLVELPLLLPDLHNWAARRRLCKGLFDEGLALHHLLGEVFGSAALQPFRLMVASRATRATLYAYSAQPAQELLEMAQSVAPPANARFLNSTNSAPSPARPAHGGRAGGSASICVCALSSD